jgi:RNA recognition motif-containing protein
MSLGDFLGDDTSGSWADEMADLPTAPAASSAPREERPGGFSRGFGDRYGGDESRDDGFSRGPRRDRDDESRPRYSRPPAELPIEPPFTAHIANLSFDAVEDDLADFFKDMKIANIRVLRDRESDRPKGFGYIEFEDQESLKQALTLTGEPLHNRPVRVNIADPPKERTDRVPDRTETSSWRRATPLEPTSPESREPRRGYGFGDREGNRGGFRDREHGRQGGDRERGFQDRPRDTSWSGGAFSKRGNFGRDREAPSERPRLHLQPRSTSGAQSSDAPRASKGNPFGGAKPIDSDEALKKLEERRKAKD